MARPDANDGDAAGFPYEAESAEFLRRRSGDAPRAIPASELQRVEHAWQAVADHASAPELIAMRTQALGRLRRANARRWLGASAFGGLRVWGKAAAVVAIAVALGVAWQLSPFGYASGRFETRTGEQRMLDLPDGSRVALDAQTRIRVRYTDDVRLVQLTEGQAQFSVEHDPQRPFRVQAGRHTIVALGTSFSVEYVDDHVQVAMIDGRVLVTTAAPQGGTGEPASAGQHPTVQATELSAGQGLRVRGDGAATYIASAGIAAATAWRQGKVIFESEPLSEAARRLNRYSRLKVVIDDPRLAQLSVSGVFEAGDTREFVQTMESYLHLAADYSEAGVVRLSTRR